MNIHSIYDEIFKHWRSKRMALFIETIDPNPDELLLDVGGTPTTWTAQPQMVLRIDCLNIQPPNWRGESTPGHNIESIPGDGCALQFDDSSYDIVFSNSVIEHVGDWERQCLFASEVRRVARKLWIQTPAYECPVEPHFLAPFVHWLPVPLRKFCVRWLSPWAWITRPDKDEVNDMVTQTRLLTRSQVSELFPDCEILTERLLGIFPKSYVAYRTDGSGNSAGP